MRIEPASSKDVISNFAIRLTHTISFMIKFIYSRCVLRSKSTICATISSFEQFSDTFFIHIFDNLKKVSENVKEKKVLFMIISADMQFVDLCIYFRSFDDKEFCSKE